MPAIPDIADDEINSLKIDSQNANVKTLKNNEPGNTSLLDTMELIEYSQPLQVPNHLKESKIYSRVARNAIVQAQPEEVHFTGFEPGGVFKQLIRFTNVSSEVTRFHILPPDTRFFKLFYNKPQRLVPGFSVDCTLEFHPDEYRYYYDVLRVHSKDEENNLVIPIHGYPVMKVCHVPEHIKFKDVPVGESETKIIPLKSSAAIQFQFKIEILNGHPSFEVKPLKGSIPSHGVANITVIFTPFDFVTARTTLQITVSEFNSKPFICNITGYSEPGQKRRDVRIANGETAEFPDAAVLDPRIISPLDRARSKRIIEIKPSKQKTVDKKKENSIPLFPPEKEVITRNGLRFPIKLDTPASVAYVLNQQPGKLSMKELREAMEKRENLSEATRQMKETIFEQEVRQDVYEERQNQLRWQVKLGSDPVTESERDNIFLERQLAWIRYFRNRGDPDVNEELERRTLTYSKFKPYRPIKLEEDLEIESQMAQFDLFVNDEWPARQAALLRFRKAAWTVIRRLRAEMRLKGLRQMKLHLLNGIIGGPPKISTSELAPEENQEQAAQDLQKEIDNDEREEDSKLLTLNRIGRINFPCADSLGGTSDLRYKQEFHVPGTEVSVRHTYPYFSLAVPQQWRLLHYDKIDIHMAASNYITSKAERSLRNGPQDEVVAMPLPPELEIPIEVKIDEDTLRLAEMAGLPAEDMNQLFKKEEKRDFLMKPPESLFKPIEYPPLHVFNPSPGLQTYQMPFSWSENDPDFHLCPLPTYEAKADNKKSPTVSSVILGQKHYFDPENVIKGATSWRNFASPSLASLGQVQTLTSVWQPRWTDCFNNHLMPTDAPNILSALPEDDAENLVEDDPKEESIHLTPAMVMAEFPVLKQINAEPKDVEIIKVKSASSKNKEKSAQISASQVPRWVKERELDTIENQNANNLGKRVHKRVEYIESLLADKELHLD